MTNWQAKGFVALLLVTAAVQAAPAYAGCPAGTVQTGERREETATAIIIHPICQQQAPQPVAPPPASSGNVQKDYCKAKKLLAGDTAGLRKMNFNADVEQFERFEEVSQEQKDEFQKKTVDALLDQGLEVAEKGVNAAKSLNPWSVNTAINNLKAKGLTNELLFKSMRRVAATKGKPEMAVAYKEFVEQMKAAKEGYDTGTDMAKEPDHAGLSLLLGALKVVQTNPELGLAVTGAEYAESFAYLGYLSNGINEQTALTDQKMASLAKITAQMKKHVADLNKAKADWAKLGNGALPECSP